MGKKEVKANLLAEKRVYDDSPSVTVTYKDLSRLIDHIIELDKETEIKGFNNKEQEENMVIVRYGAKQGAGRGKGMKGGGGGAGSADYVYISFLLKCQTKKTGQGASK